MDLFNDATMVGLLAFLAVATLTFCVMVLVRSRGSVRRRAAVIGDAGAADGPRTLRSSGLDAARRVLDHATKHYTSSDTAEMKVLRRRLLLAGIYNSSAVGFFFLVRTLSAVLLALAVFFFAPISHYLVLWMFAGVGGIAGYIAPSMYLDRRIKARQAEHQSGFPDFMDLLVVCADAGLSMEASLDRVGRELGDCYASLRG